MEQSKPRAGHTRPGKFEPRFNRTGWALMAFVGVMVGALFLTGWQDALKALRELGPLKLLGLCGLAGAHYVLRALRWHILVRAGDVQTSVQQNALHFFGGFALTATPGRVGELVRLRWLMRATGRGFGDLLPIAFADRAIELAAIVGLIAIALSAANLGTTAAWWVLLAGAVLVAIACRPQFLEVTLVGIWRLIGGRAARLFVKLRRMTRKLKRFMRWSVMLPTLAIGVIGWAFEGLAFWLLLDWLGASIHPATAAAIFLTAVLSGALSGLPGGLGGTEATAVTLLLLQGVPLETAILATGIIRVATLWFAVMIGFIVFPFAELRAKSDAEARA